MTTELKTNNCSLIRVEYDELRAHLSGALSNLRGLADTIDIDLPGFIDVDWQKEVRRGIADALAVVVNTTEQALRLATKETRVNA